MRRFSNILLVFEPDADNRKALDRAVALAQRNGARLTLAAVAPELGPIANDTLRDAVAGGIREELRHLVSLVPPGSIDIDSRLLEGVAFVEIIRAVLGSGFDLVIKAAQHADDADESLGATDKKLLRKCPCPVWIAQPDTSDHYHRILVAVDYRPDSPENDALNRQLLEMASSLAYTEDAQLHVVHAWRLHGEQTLRSLRTGLDAGEVDEVVNTAADKRRTWLEGIVAAHCEPHEGRPAPEVHLLRDSASAAVPALARASGAELVVMGTVGRTGIPGYFIGNTAETILGRIDCSVLAVKPPGFESPVSPE